VQNQFALTIPEEDAKPVALSVGLGKLLWVYAKEGDKNSLAFFDAQTGQLQYTYNASEVSGVLACTDWNGEFVFYSDYQAGTRIQPRLQFARAR
jgi:hypothetical protein